MKTSCEKRGRKLAVLQSCFFLFLMVILSTSVFAYQLPEHFTLQMDNLEFLNLAVMQIGGPLGDGIEDNWGIASVNAIYGANPLNPVWKDGDSGEHLRLMYWGLDTTSNDGGSFTTGKATVDVTGAFTMPYAGATVWLWDSDLPGYMNFDPSWGPGARTGYDAYPTISGGNVSGVSEVRFIFAPGVLGTQDITLGFVTGPDFSGVGAGYLDVIAGSGVIADILDTDGYPTDFGARDIFFRFNFSFPGPYGWQLASTDPVFGNTVNNAIPEPATLLLCATGLAGIGLARRGMKK